MIAFFATIAFVVCGTITYKTLTTPDCINNDDNSNGSNSYNNSYIPYEYDYTHRPY